MADACTHLIPPDFNRQKRDAMTWEAETADALRDIANRVSTHELYGSDVKTLRLLTEDIAHLVELREREEATNGS